MKQRILLIEPPFYRFKGTNSEIFPIGLGYIAGLLHKNGYEVHVYNAEQFSDNEKTSVVSHRDLMKNHELFIVGLKNLDHDIWQEVKKYIEKYTPTVIGMGVNTTKLRSALLIAEIAKKINPSIQIVMGGLHPTLMPEEVLQSEYVDYVVRGEGEFTFLEIINAIEEKKDMAEIKGISYKKGKRIIHNQNKEFLENLDLLPFPNKSLLIEEQISKAVNKIILCSRGCPYRCGFCNSANIWGRKPRFHSVDAVIKEIKRIIQTEKEEHIQFFDDTFTYNRKWVTDFCNQMILENLPVTWSCLTRVDKIDEDIVRLMKKAKCTHIAFGIESGSQRVLDAVKKDITLNQIDQAQILMKKVGMPWNAFIMFGLPYETKEDMQATLSLMKKLTCDNIRLSTFTPYPGTEIYSYLEKQELISRNWEHYSHQSEENHFNTHVSPEEYKKILQEAIHITDRKNMHVADLCKKAWKKKGYFLQNPTELGGKMLNVLRSMF